MPHREITPSGPLARAGWTLRRFGLTPRGVLARLRESDAPGVLCVCIPKAGTHLLERALCLHPAFHRRLVRTINDTNLPRLGGLSCLLDELRPGQVLMSHLRFGADRKETIDNSSARSVFLIRDPRDALVSIAMYIAYNAKHHLHDLFRAKTTLDERLRLAIEGYPMRQFPSVAERMREYAGWLGSGSLVVRFEDLVGASGGGTESRQRDTLRSVFSHLGVDCSEEVVSSVGNKLFSAVSPTFRKGHIGGWREHFDANMEDRFMELAGDYLALYGYSTESRAGARAS